MICLIDALNITPQGKKSPDSNSNQEAISILTDQKWLSQVAVISENGGSAPDTATDDSDDDSDNSVPYLIIGPRTIAELSPWISKIVPDTFEKENFCDLCKTPVILGQKCSNCNLRLHYHCTFKESTLSSSKQHLCSRCATPWPPVPEVFARHFRLAAEKETSSDSGGHHKSPHSQVDDNSSLDDQGDVRTSDTTTESVVEFLPALIATHPIDGTPRLPSLFSKNEFLPDPSTNSRDTTGIESHETNDTTEPQ